MFREFFCWSYRKGNSQESEIIRFYKKKCPTIAFIFYDNKTIWFMKSFSQLLLSNKNMNIEITELYGCKVKNIGNEKKKPFTEGVDSCLLYVRTIQFHSGVRCKIKSSFVSFAENFMEIVPHRRHYNIWMYHASLNNARWWNIPKSVWNESHNATQKLFKYLLKRNQLLHCSP